MGIAEAGFYRPDNRCPAVENQQHQSTDGRRYKTAPRIIIYPFTEADDGPHGAAQSTAAA